MLHDKRSKAVAKVVRPSHFLAQEKTAALTEGTHFETFSRRQWARKYRSSILQLSHLQNMS